MIDTFIHVIGAILIWIVLILMALVGPLVAMVHSMFPNQEKCTGCWIVSGIGAGLIALLLFG